MENNEVNCPANHILINKGGPAAAQVTQRYSSELSLTSPVYWELFLLKGFQVRPCVMEKQCFYLLACDLAKEGGTISWVCN